MEGMSVHIERMLDAARTAPSHDNTQPWRFTIHDAGERISFSIDRERDPSPDGAMARMAIGAALECACVAAGRMGSTVRFHEPVEGAVVTISITPAKRLPDPDLSRTRRVTNRRPYDGRALDDATALALQKATPARERAQILWFGRERVRALGPLFEQAEELFFLDARLRERAVSAIRFDVKDREEVTRGISLGSLELTSAERATLVGVRKPLDPLAAISELKKKMSARARRLIESASGVCVVTIAGTDPMADVDVGRAVQRAWMSLTQRGLAAHPMTTMMSLAASATGASTDTAENGGDGVERRVAEVLAAFRGAFPSVAHNARIAFLMRFGWAEAPSCRVGRLPLDESLAR